MENIITAKTRGRPKRITEAKRTIASPVSDSFLKEVNVFSDKHQVSIALMIREGLKMFMKNFNGFNTH